MVFKKKDAGDPSALNEKSETSAENDLPAALPENAETLPVAEMQSVEVLERVPAADGGAELTKSAIASQPEPVKTVYPPRNIKYVGRVVKDKTGKIIQNDAPITRTAGANVIVLPPFKEQIEKRIFWHDEAGKIAALYPHLYKLVKTGKKHKRGKI